MEAGIHHISLKADGVQQSRAILDFYQNVLSCPLIHQWGEGEQAGAMLNLGNVLLEVMATGGAGLEKGRFAHIAFRSEDVDHSIEQVRRAGRPILVEPKDVNLGGTYPARVGFCLGPAGEEIEFFQDQRENPA